MTAKLAYTRGVGYLYQQKAQPAFDIFENVDLDLVKTSPWNTDFFFYYAIAAHALKEIDRAQHQVVAFLSALHHKKEVESQEFRQIGKLRGRGLWPSEYDDLMPMQVDLGFGKPFMIFGYNMGSAELPMPPRQIEPLATSLFVSDATQTPMEGASGSSSEAE